MGRLVPGHGIQVFVFTSPKAGSGAGRDQIPRLVEVLRGRRVPVWLVHDMDELKRRLADAGPGRTSIVVAAGGDGTQSLAASIIDEVARAMATRRGAEFAAGEGIWMLPMPMGTENLLARHFGYLPKADAVVETICHGRVRLIDSGLANASPFLVMASCGFDAEVVRGMHLTRRGHINRFSYWWPILRAVRRYRFPKLTITVDDREPFHAGWAMVFNLPCYAAGLAIEPDAIDDDGQLDVIAFAGRSLTRGLRYLAGITLGGHLTDPEVVRVRGRSISVTSESRVPYQLDGDYAGRLPVEIRSNPGRVRLLLPRQHPLAGVPIGGRNPTMQ